MSKVNQCDRCKIIFEPRVEQVGDLYIARRGSREIDLCPNCYKLLTCFLAQEVENHCRTCRFKEYMRIEPPCNKCCYSHDSCYVKEEEV